MQLIIWFFKNKYGLKKMKHRTWDFLNKWLTESVLQFVIILWKMAEISRILFYTDSWRKRTLTKTLIISENNLMW